MTPRKNGGPWRQGNLLAFPGCKKSLPPPSPFLPLLHTPPGRLRRPCSSYSGSRRRCRRQSRQKCLFSPRLVSFLFLFFAGAKRQLKKRRGDARHRGNKLFEKHQNQLHFAQLLQQAFSMHGGRRGGGRGSRCSHEQNKREEEDDEKKSCLFPRASGAADGQTKLRN